MTQLGSQFYELETFPKAEKSSSATEFEWSDGPPQLSAEPERCTVCGSMIGPCRRLSPYSGTLTLLGAELGDMAFGMGRILVSERFRVEYEKAGLRGLTDFSPVHFERIIRRHRRAPGKNEVPPFFYTEIARSRMGVDDVKSELVRRRPPACPDCGGPGAIRAKRIVFLEEEWDGLDIFEPRNLGGAFVSRRFRDWSISSGLKNIVLMPCEQAAFETEPWNI